MPNKPTKRYTLERIKMAIMRAYEIHSHKDDWNVPVVYEGTMLRKLNQCLRYASRQPITPPKKKTK